MHSTGNQAIHFIAFQHQSTQHNVVFQLFAGNNFGDTFALTQLYQTRHITLTRFSRIDNFNAIAQYDALLFSNTTDFIRITQQYRTRNTTISTDSCSFDSTRFVTFRQNDTFVGSTSQFGQLITERRWAQTTRQAGFGCQ
eukprot:RCo009464